MQAEHVQLVQSAPHRIGTARGQSTFRRETSLLVDADRNPKRVTADVLVRVGQQLQTVTRLGDVRPGVEWFFHWAGCDY